MDNRNIIIDMHQSALRNPEKTALIDRKTSIFKKPVYQHITYSRLFKDITATAVNLKKSGFVKGDRIIVFVPMSYSLYVLCLAVSYIGAVSVFIDAWADKDRLSKACKVVNPKGFIGTLKAQILRINPEIRKIPLKKTASSLLVMNSSTGIDFNPEHVDAEDEALITLTTGTTGLPKGVRRTHGALSEQFSVLKGHMTIEEPDVDLTALPIFVFLNLAIGSTSVLPLFNPAKPSSFDPESIVRQIRELNITTSIGSPVFYEKIADYLISKDETLTLNAIFTGGAPVFKSLAEKLIKAFPGTEIEIVYGCTEAEPISGISINESIACGSKPGIPAGRNVKGVEVKVVKATSDPILTGRANPLGSYLADTNEVGEIIVSGPHVMKDYLGDPELFDKNKIRDGARIWHRTGDAGVVEPDGSIYIYGRVGKRFLSRGGDKYPVPYEQRLMEIDGVTLSSVLEKDNMIYAVVEAEKSLLNNEDILPRIRDELTGLEPDHIVLMKKIPRDPRHNSKVDYEELLEKLKSAPSY